MDLTKSSGWLYTWAWAIEKASKNQSAAWKFISWASGKGYIQTAGQQLGWAKVPPGTRTSTYSDPNYLKQASAFAQPTLTAINTANPSNPGVQPRFLTNCATKCARLRPIPALPAKISTPQSTSSPPAATR